MKQETPRSTRSKVMAKVKVFKKQLKGQGQGSPGQNFVSNGNVFAEGIYMCNMKGLALMVQKL